MKRLVFAIVSGLLLCLASVSAQTIQLNRNGLEAIQVSMSAERLMEKEAIYIRPTNGRADSQLRRNRSTQYFSFPDYSFERFRKEAPGEYESYTDMGLNEWMRLKIDVKGNQAKLFINNNRQPSLIVNDLKHGANASGGVGLWVDVGTEGFFTDLKVRRD